MLRNHPTTTTNVGGSHTKKRKRLVAPLLDPKFLTAISTAVSSSLSLSSSPSTTTASLPHHQHQHDVQLQLQQLQLTNGAVQALHDCQEEFMVALTHALQQQLQGHHQSSSDDNNTHTKKKAKLVHVMPRHVQAAMSDMGMDAIVQEALQHLHDKDKNDATPTTTATAPSTATTATTAKPTATRRNASKKKKKKPFHITAELQAEQERLLQASRDKRQL